MNRLVINLFIFIALIFNSNPTPAATILATSSYVKSIGLSGANGRIGSADFEYIGLGVKPNGEILPAAFTWDTVSVSVYALDMNTDKSICGAYSDSSLTNPVKFTSSGPMLIALPNPVPVGCYAGWKIEGTLRYDAPETYTQSLYVTIYHKDGSPEQWSSGEGQAGGFNATSSCGMTVDDSVDFGTLFAGTNKTKIIGISDVTGAARLQFTGLDIQNDGTLYLGGNKSVIIKPENVSVSNGGWVTSGSNGGVTLNLDVDKNTTPGEYTSLLTAKLTCR